jgi:uncharacterized protein (TIGR03086 family)
MEDDMELRSLMARASEVAVEVVRGLPDRLDGPTPCAEMDVRALVNHLILWTGRGHAAALKQPLGGPADDHDFTAEPGWADAYATQAAATAQVWSDPGAWAGETGITAQGLMPAPFVGGIMFGEWLLHGWDLAVATGQSPAVDKELATALYESVAIKAELARQHNVFGPEVPVPASAPPFDRALGLSGRDPFWKP